MTAGPGADDNPPGQPEISTRLFTIPNLLCMVRLAGSVVLLPIALAGRSEWFLGLFLLLATPDWLDGKLAILLNQRSVFGARLDSWADAALYAALLFGMVVMYGDTLRAELSWIAPALLSYLLSTVAGLWKYHRWPSYHTRAAKISWFLTGCAVIALFLGWAVWPLRLAAVAITLTNLEALCITWLSPRWRVDVAGVWQVWRAVDRQP